jgi:predicted nucleic acid-binding protein
MGLKYLWDTNAVIYYLQKHFPPEQESLMDNVINNYQPAISIITEIELLCWKMATEIDLALLHSFISDCTIFNIEQDIKLQTIEVRKQTSLKLPDAIIAATALTKRLTLISSNSSDFKKVRMLDFVDPYTDTEKLR